MSIKKIFISIIISILVALLVIQLFKPKPSYATGNMSYYWNGDNFDIYGDGLQTTYNDNGYATYLKVGDSEERVYGSYREWNGVTCQISLSSVNDNNYVKITYKLTNKTSEQKVVGVATTADIQIGSNDNAPMNNLPGNIGCTMSDDVGHTFKFLGRDTYGVVNVDTYWMGHADLRNDWNRWEQAYDFIEGDDDLGAGPYDAGIQWSWQNRRLDPYGNMELSVLIGVGDINDPPTITVNDLSKSTYTIGETVNISGKVNDINSGDIVAVRYSIDGGEEKVMTSGIVPNGNARDYNSSFVIPTSLSGGSHYVQIWAADNHRKYITSNKKVF